MIVRDLLIRLGFRADWHQVDETDRKINRMKTSSVALGAALGTVAARLAEMGMRAVADHMQKSVDASLEFGRAMGKIQTLLPAGSEDAKDYAAAINRLSREMGVASSDIAGGLYDVISTFGSTAETVDQLNIAVKAGIAGNGTTADGLALLGAVTKAYGDTSAATMRKVSDLGFTTVNLGKVELPELAGSIGRVTPMAATLGLSLEELNAVFATFTGVTGSGAEVSTQFAATLRALIDRTPAMQKAFKAAFGQDKSIKTMKDALSKHGLQGVMLALTKQTDGTAEGVQRLFGRAEAMTLSLAMTGKQADDYRGKLAAMNGAQGATEAAYKQNTEGMAAQAHALDLAKAAAEAQRRELGDQLLPQYIELEKVGGRIAELFGSQIVPIFTDTNAAMGDMLGSADPLEDTFRAIAVVVASVAAGIDAVTYGLGETVRLAVLAARITAAGKTGESRTALLDDYVTGARTRADAFGNRMSTRGQIIEGEETDAARVRRYAREADAARAATRERDRARTGARTRADALRETMGLAPSGQSFRANVDTVNVNVTVPAGTEASAAARIGDTGARVLLEQMLANAARSYPDQTPQGAGG